MRFTTLRFSHYGKCILHQTTPYTSVNFGRLTFLTILISTMASAIETWMISLKKKRKRIKITEARTKMVRKFRYCECERSHCFVWLVWYTIIPISSTEELISFVTSSFLPDTRATRAFIWGQIGSGLHNIVNQSWKIQIATLKHVSEQLPALDMKYGGSSPSAVPMPHKMASNWTWGNMLPRETREPCLDENTGGP